MKPFAIPLLLLSLFPVVAGIAQEDPAIEEEPQKGHEMGFKHSNVAVGQTEGNPPN
jgi:hypothetical protein